MNTVSLISTPCQPSNKINPLVQRIVRFAVAMLLVGCLSMVTAQQSSVYAQETIVHTVRSGETVSSIARKYGVSVGTVLSYNSIADPNLLRPGQMLTIPVANRAASAPQAQNTSVPAPASAPAATATPRSPKAMVIYPSPTPTRPVAETRYYTVRPNDTLYGIAARYGVTVQAIKARNRISGNVIYVGQLLAIP